jgi:alkanesulfonate monooxygenase SsuD/methylene tetrahydromethanopterin reductase-like flavin-dependent oxidoreductase (luciferase family)
VYIQRADAIYPPNPDPTPRSVGGGRGAVKTPRLAAAHADELNTFGATADQCVERRAALDRFCEEAGRDPAEVALSVMAGCVVGENEDVLAARMRRLGKLLGRDLTADELAPTWIVGTPEQAADRIGELAATGVGRLMLQHLLYDDLDMLDLVADEVAPKL